MYPWYVRLLRFHLYCIINGGKILRIMLFYSSLKKINYIDAGLNHPAFWVSEILFIIIFSITFYYAYIFVTVMI